MREKIGFATGKCWINLTDAAPARTLVIVFDETTTGINTMADGQRSKVVVN